MVVAIHGEADWMPNLEAMPRFALRMTPTVIVAPHPDDETLGCGGMIHHLRKAGVPVTVVAATDGEHAYPDEETPASSVALGALREAEQAAALLRLGVAAGSIVRLRLTDSGLMDQGAALRDGIRGAVRAAGADAQIIAPWCGDFHPDHEACASAASDVAAETGAALLSYIFWTWHRGTPAMLAAAAPQRVAMTLDEISSKASALACHASQLQQEDGKPVLPAELLWPARLAFEVVIPA